MPCRADVIQHLRPGQVLLPEESPLTCYAAGMRAKGALCWLCGLSVPGLSQQALLLVQTAWTHNDDLSLQNCPRARLYTGCFIIWGYLAKSCPKEGVERQVNTYFCFCTFSQHAPCTCVAGQFTEQKASSQSSGRMQHKFHHMCGRLRLNSSLLWSANVKRLLIWAQSCL